MMRLSLILIFVSVCRSSLTFLQDQDNDIAYDSYVFTVNWGNTLCLKHPQCEQKERISDILTIHGLWPSLLSGQRIPDCNQGTVIPIKDSKQGVYQRMVVYWLSLMDSNEKFWTHEYNKHGYCYVQKEKYDAPEPYFEKAMALYDELEIETIMEKLQLDEEENYDYKVLLTKFKSAYPEFFIDLACMRINGKQYFKELRFIYDLDFKPSSKGKSDNQCKKTDPIYIPFKKNVQVQ